MMIQKIIYVFVAILVLAACANEDFSDKTTKPDEAKLIMFTVGSEQQMTRARNYISYNSTTDPETMSTFGIFGGYVNDVDSSIWNDCATYQGAGATTVTFKPSVEKHWADYDHYDQLDFFACMPYSSSTLLVKNDDKDFTLSFPVDLGGPFVTEYPAKKGLIATAPVRMDDKVGQPVTMQFDQILTGFQLQFQLGDMIRQFRVKSVKLEQKSMPMGGTVSRRYVNNGVSWSADPLQWSNLQNAAVDTADLAIANDEGEIVLVPNAVPTPWGKPFYAIPCATMTPKVKVVYDVEYVGEDGIVVTRQGEPGEIVINNENYPSYMNGGELPDTGKKHIIKIKIMPEYLYKLADADQKRGVLVIKDRV